MDFIPDRYIRFGQIILQSNSFPVVICYLMMIALSGFWVRNTKALVLRKVLIYYNMICVGLSVVAAALTFYGVFEGRDIFSMKNSSSIKNGIQIYMISKYIELLDTVFMIVRHRRRQISFLHVYHHSSILVLADLAYYHYSCAPIALMCGMNSVIHILLYTYYAQSALTSEKRPLWRQLMTQLQIIQFLIGISHASVGFLYHGYCIYSVLYGLTMLTLFSNFYYKAYLLPRNKKIQ